MTEPTLQEIDLPAEQPDQESGVPRWEFKPRKDPKWGEVTKSGLIIGRGDNKKVVPPDEVYKLALIGASYEEMADFFQVNRETLKYNFSEYIQKAKAEMKSKLRRAMWKNATENNNVVMQIFLAKNYLSMSDNPVNSDDKQPLPWNSSDTEAA